MLEKRLKTVDDVKKRINADSFEELDEKKLNKLKKMLPKLDKDVALKVVEHMPDYIAFSKEMVTGLTEICKKCLESGDTAHKDAVEGYMLVLNSLKAQLESGELTDSQKDTISLQMIEVANSISNESDKHRQFVSDMFSKGIKGLAIFGGIVLAVLLALNNDNKGGNGNNSL